MNVKVGGTDTLVGERVREKNGEVIKKMDDLRVLSCCCERRERYFINKQIIINIEFHSNN